MDGVFHTSLGPKRDCGITAYKHQVEHKTAISPEAFESETDLDAMIFAYCITMEISFNTYPLGPIFL